LANRIYSQIFYVDKSTEKAVVTVWPSILTSIKYNIAIEYARRGASLEFDPVFQTPAPETDDLQSLLICNPA